MTENMTEYVWDGDEQGFRTSRATSFERDVALRAVRALDGAGLGEFVTTTSGEVLRVARVRVVQEPGDTFVAVECESASGVASLHGAEGLERVDSSQVVTVDPDGPRPAFAVLRTTTLGAYADELSERLGISPPVPTRSPSPVAD